MTNDNGLPYRVGDQVRIINPALRVWLSAQLGVSLACWRATSTA